LAAQSAHLLPSARRLAHLAMIFVTVAIFGMSVLTASAQVRIGNEAQVALPTSAHYSGTVNIRPGHGEVVNLNPPIFSWFYVSNIVTASMDSGTYWEFQFQVSTNKEFTNNIVNKRTPSNLYNTLAPFTNSDGSVFTGPLYWRVGYISTNGVTNRWSVTNSFTISANASAWDRSMLADEAYLRAKDVHPRLLFNSATRAATYQFLQTNNPTDWTVLKIRYHNAINASWWTNKAAWPTNNGAFDITSRSLDLGSALTYWALSQTTEYPVTNYLADNFIRFVNWYRDTHYEFNDYGGNGDQPLTLHCLALGYDWLYPVLSEQQKSNAVFAIQRTARFYNRNAFWSTRKISGHWELDPTGAYNEPRLIPWYNSARAGTSHQWRDASMVCILAASAYGEGGDIREFYDLWINYMIGRTHFTGGFAAINQGRGYAHIQIGGGGIVWNTIAFMSAFPEAQLNRIPMIGGMADWFSRLTPPGYMETHSTHGDFGFKGRASYWNNADFKQLSMLARDGNAWQAHLNETAFGANGAENYFFNMLVQPLVWPPPAPTTNTNSKLFVEDGWLIASTKPANAIDAFTNGLGFVFTARPRGSEGGHSLNCDGAVEIWAYGAKVTDGGGHYLDPYAYQPEAQDTLFVNGQGVKMNNQYGLYSGEPVLPWYARIAAYKTSSDFTYALGDITPAFTNTYNPQKANVLKVKRHVLLSRTGKYFLLYDELATRNPSTFHWQWHVLQPTLRNLTTSGFVYSSTNRLRQSITNHIFHASAGLAVDNMTGASALKNPFTGVTFSDAGDPFRRAHALWYRNATQATNFTFLSVIVPQEPGKSAPSFTRLDNQTVVVTYDGVTETNTFGTNYAGAFTYRVELTGDRSTLNVQVPQGVRIAPPQ
jgi:hypothetical protein